MSVEANNVEKEVNKNSDGETKPVEGPNKEIPKPLPNSMDEKTGQKKAEPKQPNGNKEESVEDGKNVDESEKVTLKLITPLTSDATDGQSSQKQPAATTTPTPPAASETTAPPTETSAKSEEKKEGEEVNKEGETAEKPATSGKKGPVRGKKGAATGRGRPTKKGEGSDDKGEIEAKESDQVDKKPESAAEEKAKPDTKEKEIPAPKKRGQKRGAEAAPESTVSKTAKSDEGGPSGIQTGGEHDDKKTPLMELPLIMEGKRQRQKVERLDSSMLAVSHHAEQVEAPQGSGTKLGDIPFIASMLTKTGFDDLKPLHRIIFGRAGSAHEIRKNLRAFNGFDFQKDTEAFTKKLKQMDKWNMKHIKKICEVLGLERGGTKEHLQTVIMEFLVRPSDTGKKLPEKGKKKSTSGTRKRSASAQKGGTAKKAKGKAATTSDSDAGETEESGKSDKGDESEEKDEQSEEKDEESDQEQPPKKRARKAPAAKKGKVAPAKAASTSASTSKKTPARGKAAKTDKKSGPTDADLKKTIQELLKGANLEEVTMKDMCSKVFAKYPEQDLTSRKDFIKDTVKKLIASPAAE